MAKRTEPTVQQLRALVELSRGMSAEDLGMSGEGLYQLMQRLNDALFGPQASTTVVERGQATDAGRQIAVEAEQIVDLLDKLLATARSISDLDTLEVGCYPAHVSLVTHAGELWQQQGRGRAFRLDEISDRPRMDSGRGLARMVRSGRLNCAVVAAHQSESFEPLHAEVLYEWPVTVVTTDPAIARVPNLELGELVERRVLLATSPRGHLTRHLLEDTGVALQVAFESVSVEAVVGMGRRNGYTSLVAGDAHPIAALREAGVSMPVLMHQGVVIGGCAALIGHRGPALDGFLTAMRTAVAVQWNGRSSTETSTGRVEIG